MVTRIWMIGSARVSASPGMCEEGSMIEPSLGDWQKAKDEMSNECLCDETDLFGTFNPPTGPTHELKCLCKKLGRVIAERNCLQRMLNELSSCRRKYAVGDMLFSTETKKTYTIDAILRLEDGTLRYQIGRALSSWSKTEEELDEKYMRCEWVE
jgi:hypothetical protein